MGGIVTSSNKTYKIKIIDVNKRGRYTYQLIKIKLPKLSRSSRARIIYKIMEELNVMAMIEMYPKEGIVRKPKREFYAILISSV